MTLTHFGNYSSYTTNVKLRTKNQSQYNTNNRFIRKIEDYFLILYFELKCSHMWKPFSSFHILRTGIPPTFWNVIPLQKV